MSRYTSTDTLEKSGKQRDGEQDGEFKKQSVLWELLVNSSLYFFFYFMFIHTHPRLVRVMNSIIRTTRQKPIFSYKL